MTMFKAGDAIVVKATGETGAVLEGTNGFGACLVHLAGRANSCLVSSALLDNETDTWSHGRDAKWELWQKGNQT